MDREREPLPSRVQDTPDLPPAYGAALEAGLAELGLVLDDAAGRAIDGHVRLLLAWTGAINLTAIREPGAVATAHVVDALSAVPLVRSWGTDRFLDLGTGGGFPGIPLAAAVPARDALLVEPVGKKARFLAVVAEATGLGAGGRLRVAATRAETLAADPHHRGHWPLVTARAVAPLADLVELAFPLLAPGGCLIAWKRGELRGELASARVALAALGGGTLEVIPVGVPALPGHVLVVATRTGDVPAPYPRDPALRKRRPWAT